MAEKNNNNKTMNINAREDEDDNLRMENFILIIYKSRHILSVQKGFIALKKKKKLQTDELRERERERGAKSKSLQKYI